MAGPLISVIVPGYNVSRYIAETIGSVLRQTFTDYEIVVVNDGSPDTPELEAALEPFRDRIVYLKQSNRGPSAARNTGIRAARGEYIALLDGDDMWEPEFLEHMTGKLRDRGLDAIYCDTLVFGNTPLAGRTGMQLHPSSGPCTLEAMLKGSVTVYTSAMVMRKAAAVEAGLFDEGMWRSEDFDLWMRMALNGARFGYDDAVLGRRRMHGEGLSASEVKMLEGARHAVRKLLNNSTLPAELRGLAERRCERLDGLIAMKQARLALQAGEPEAALNLLRQAGNFTKAWKVRFAIALLSIAPSLAPAATRWWRAFILWRQQTRSGRTPA